MVTLWVPGRLKYVYYVFRCVQAHRNCVSIVYNPIKIACRLSRFLTKWYFRTKVFCAPGSKIFMSYYLYRTRFIQNIILS